MRTAVFGRGRSVDPLVSCPSMTFKVPLIKKVPERLYALPRPSSKTPRALLGPSVSHIPASSFHWPQYKYRSYILRRCRTSLRCLFSRCMAPRSYWRTPALDPSQRSGCPWRIADVLQAPYNSRSCGESAYIRWEPESIMSCQHPDIAQGKLLVSCRSRVHPSSC